MYVISRGWALPWVALSKVSIKDVCLEAILEKLCNISIRNYT